MKPFSQFLNIFKREVLAYFNSPIAYIFAVVFVVLNCGMFMTHFYIIGRADMREFFNILPIILCVFIPALTMRSWAEEKRENTMALLLTFPLKTRFLVLGKFAAGLVFYAFALLGTIAVPIMLSLLGQPDMGPIIGGYLGAFFVGGLYMAIGLFLSGLSKDQIVAFVLSMIVCFFFYLIGLDYLSSVIDGWLPGVGSFLRDNFAMTNHFTGFQRGVVDLRDVLYFVIMIAIFLVLNGLAIEDRLRPKAKVFFSGAVGVCLFISLLSNFLVQDTPIGRFDLTENKIYTVSETSKNILKALRSTVSVKLYISPKDKMPTGLKSLEEDIMGKLEELQVVSGGKLQVKVFHMEPEIAAEVEGEKETSLEEKLAGKGIRPFQVQSIDQDELGIKLVYAGLTIAYKEKPEEILPQIVPESLSNLEYDLISKIYRLTLVKQPKIAILAPYEEKAVNPQMLAFMKQLGQSMPDQMLEDAFKIPQAALKYEGYDVSRIRLTKDEPIPEGTDTLLILAPTLNERQRYEIGRFLASGGNVFLAAQYYEHDYQPVGRKGFQITPRQTPIGVNELFEPYGLRISEKILMDANHEMLSIAGGQNLGPFSMPVPVKVPTHVAIHQQSMNDQTAITSNLGSIFYLWGSSLDLDEAKIQSLKLDQKTLFTSSADSWLVPSSGGPLQAAELAGGKFVYDGPHPLAVMLEGQFPDLSSDQPVPSWPAEPGETPETNAEEKPASINLKPGKLIVVGCSKMFEENFIQGGGMLTFLMNAVDSLTLGGELISIRSKKMVDRRIEKLTKPEKLWYRFLSTILLPVLIILYGIFRLVMRRKEKENYVRQVSAKEVSE